MQDWSKLIAAAVVPVVIISACGLLCLAFYNRLAVIVTRLRAFQRERLHEQERLEGHATTAEHRLRSQRVLELLDTQTAHVTRRAHLVQRALMCLLTTIGCLIVTSLLLGLGQYLAAVVPIAALCFVAGMLTMLLAVGFAMRELALALDPIRDEARIVAALGATLDEEPVTTGVGA